MASPSAPPGDTIKITFSDIPSAIVLEDVLRLSTRFQGCVAKLGAISGQVVHLIEGLPQRRAQGQGLTLTDGPWWFRLVKPGDTGGSLRLVKGAWKRLQNRYDYDTMLIEADLKIGKAAGWVEFKHEWQKQRDDAKAIQDFVDRKLPLTASHQPQSNLWPQGNARNESPDFRTPRDAENSRVLTPLVVSSSVGTTGEIQSNANIQRTYPRLPGGSTMTYSSSQDSQYKIGDGEPSQTYTQPEVTGNGVYADDEHVCRLDAADGRDRRLPVTPRPGPFPAQIGTPPSDAYHQYQAAFPDGSNWITSLSDEAIVKEGLRDNTDHGQAGIQVHHTHHANQQPLYNGTGFITYDTHPMAFTPYDASWSSYPTPDNGGMRYAYSQQPNLAQFYPGGQANLNLGYQAAPYFPQTPIYQQGPVSHWQFSNPMSFHGANAYDSGHSNPNEWYVPFSRSHSHGQPSSGPWTPHRHNIKTYAMKESDVEALHSQTSGPPMQYNYGALGQTLANPPSTNGSPYFHLPAQHGSNKNTEANVVHRSYMTTAENGRFPHPASSPVRNLTREGLQEYADFLKARYSKKLRTQATLLPSLQAPVGDSEYLRHGPMPEAVPNEREVSRAIEETGVGAETTIPSINNSCGIDQNGVSSSAQHLSRTTEASSSTFKPPVNVHPPPTGLFSLPTSKKVNPNDALIPSERGTKRSLKSSVDMTTAVKRGATAGLNLKTPDIEFGFDNLRSAEEEVQRPDSRSDAGVDRTDWTSRRPLGNAGSCAASSSSPAPMSATSADDGNPMRKEYQRRIQTKQANKKKELDKKKEKERLEGMKAKKQTEGRKARAERRSTLRGFDFLDEGHGDAGKNSKDIGAVAKEGGKEIDTKGEKGQEKDE